MLYCIIVFTDLNILDDRKIEPGIGFIESWMIKEISVLHTSKTTFIMKIREK